MPEHLNFPKLRYVDAFPVEKDGETFFYVRDPLEIAPSPLLMSAVEFFLIVLFDGRHSVSDIKLEFARRYEGILLPEESIHKMVGIMDENYYLDNENYRKRTRQIIDNFKKAPVRKAWHAGVSYEDEPEKLRHEIEEMYRHPDGAGGMNGKLSDEKETLRAIMAPHIDLRVGGPCYTHAYRYLTENSQADLFIILGVAHYGGSNFFTVTDKDFATPLGVVKTDRGFIEKWSRYAGKDLSEEEWVHRTEHSIEFQLPFLQHALNRPFKIVPVLCGSMEPFRNNGNPLGYHAEISGLIEGLKRAVQEVGRRAVFILSVDLAHMGPKFGDSEAITVEMAKKIRAADHRMFDILSRFDADEYLKVMKTDLLPRRVDACSATYTLLSVMEKGKGRLLNYGQNFQEDTGSLVSYGSMVFFDK